MPILDAHPKNVYLEESAVIGSVNARIDAPFAAEHRDQTASRLLNAGATRVDTARSAAAGNAVPEAEQRLRRSRRSTRSTLLARANPRGRSPALPGQLGQGIPTLLRRRADYRIDAC